MRGVRLPMALEFQIWAMQINLCCWQQTSPAGLQRLFQAAGLYGHGHQHLQDLCARLQPGISWALPVDHQGGRPTDSQVKYLGMLFRIEAAFFPSSMNLKQKMYGTWAPSQR